MFKVDGKLADGTNTTFDGSNDDIRYKDGGQINKLTVSEFESYLEKKYEANIDLADYRNSIIYLSKIIIPKEKRSFGVGTNIMKEIISFAKSNDKIITLTPSTDFGATSISRLKEFYKKFGFVENKGRYKDYKISESMYLNPDIIYKEGGTTKAFNYTIGGL
jgi:GNAT superfamily N-acetyltransferase